MRLFRTMLAAGFAVLMMVGAAVPAAAGPAPGGYDWSGFYVGVVGSGGLFTVEQEDYWCDLACNAPTLQDWDASIGVQGGFNWQNGNLVFGVVADWSTGFEQKEKVLYNADPDGVDWEAKWNSYGTIRGRAGLATGDALIFVTAGVAIADVDYSATEFADGATDCLTDDCASVNDTLVGFAGGAGMGFPVANNVHVTLEYLYIGMPWEKDRYSTANANATDEYVSWTTSAQLARVGVVWEFN